MRFARALYNTEEGATPSWHQNQVFAILAHIDSIMLLWNTNGERTQKLTVAFKDFFFVRLMIIRKHALCETSKCG